MELIMSTGMSKVPFQDALDLVRTRKVYLKAGYAYIPHQDIVTIVLNDFRTRLSKALAVSLLPPSQVVSMFQQVVSTFTHPPLRLSLVFAATQWLERPIIPQADLKRHPRLIKRLICHLKIRCIVFTALQIR